MTKLIFLDLETTGLDPFFNDVWEVGFIVRDPDSDWGDLQRLYRVAPDLSRASVDGLRIGRFYERTSDMRDPDRDRHAVGDNSSC